MNVSTLLADLRHLRLQCVTTGEKTIPFLGEAVQRVLARQRAQIAEAVCRMRDPQLRGPGATVVLPSLSSSEASAIERHRATRYARYCAVKQLQRQGVSQQGIARTLARSHNRRHAPQRLQSMHHSPSATCLGNLCGPSRRCPHESLKAPLSPHLCTGGNRVSLVLVPRNVPPVPYSL
jgi:hypothetical protein